MSNNPDRCSPPAPRSRWRERRRHAVTLRELGTHTLDRLTNRRQRPYYTTAPGTALDDILPELTVMNTAGMVTVKVQTAADDSHSRRCALLHAFGPPDLITAVADACTQAGLDVTTCPFSTTPQPMHPPKAIAWGPEPQRQVSAISIGPCIISQYLFGFAHPTAQAAMARALSIEIVDPVPGRQDLLWSTIIATIDRFTDQRAHPTPAQRTALTPTAVRRIRPR